MGINLGVWGLRAGEENAAAIEDADQWCSYKETRARAMRIAAGLYDAGVRPGDVVALLLPNSIRTALNIFGIWTAGAAIVSLGTLQTNYEIALRLDLWPAKWALTSSGYANRFVGSRSPIRVLDVEEVERGGDRFVIPMVPLDTPALAFFTSGTTGEPKAVIHSARSVASQTVRREPFRAANNTPTGFGLISALSTLQAGGTQIFLERSVMGNQLAKALLHHRPDRAILGPQTLMSLVETGERLDPSVRQLICGGDFLSADLQKHASNVLGLHVIQVYGSTEARAMTRGNEETPPGSIGRTLPQVELQLRSEEDGSTVSGAGQGLAWVRSPKLFMGYGNRGAIERPLDKNGWFNTGDVLHRENDGNYYFLSRTSNYMKIDTIKVGPHEIEGVLRREPAVKNVHAACLKLSGEGDTVVAVLELDQIDPDLATRMESLMETYLAKFKHPKLIFATKSFPYSPAGKVDTRALETLIRSGSLRQIIPAS